jgi:NADP-dependent 3-hydroxy acid dehydrogenase YdfG
VRIHVSCPVFRKPTHPIMPHFGKVGRIRAMTSDSAQSSYPRGLAVVTGASSGIGAATARRLAAEGFLVWAAARRGDRLAELAAATAGVEAVTLDVTSADSVADLLGRLESSTDRPELTLLVNNAGGALGLDPVADANPADWLWMYEVNVLGAMRITQALLPLLQAGRGGHVVLTGSIAGYGVYEGGAGYSAAKYGARAMMETLRLELNGQPVRVSEVDPGMVATEEFSLVRFDGDSDRAAAVYAGVDEPLTADDIADVIAFVATRPAHVNIDKVTVQPIAQAAPHKVARRQR